MALVKPTLTFELGLTAGFNDAVATVVPTDITQYVQTWTTNRGRNPAKPPAHFDPGVGNLVLDNRDRRFDPTNSAGPYWPNLQPAKVRLRIRAFWLGVWYPVFCGYVKRWPPEWTASATSVTKITAVDALGAPLNLPQLQASVWDTMVVHDTPKVWLRLNESSGTVAADSSPHGLDGQYQGAPVLGLSGVVNTSPDKAAALVSASRVSLPYKNLITGYPWSMECWLRAGMNRARQRSILMAYDGPTAGGRQLVEVFLNTDGKIWALVGNPVPGTSTQVNTSVTVDDLFNHHLAVRFVSSTTFFIYVDGNDVTVTTASMAHSFPDDLVTGYAVGNTPAVTFGDFNFADANGIDALGHLAIYDYDLPPARITKHYQGGGWPTGVGEPSGGRVHRILDEADWSGDRSVATGQSGFQMLYTAGGVVANLQKVEEAEQGAVFVDESGLVVFHDRDTVLDPPYSVSQATFGQGAGDLPYEAPVTWGNDDAELYNEASGSRVGGRTFVVADAASQAAYGRRPLAPLTGLLNMTDAEVVDLLTYRVQKYAQPVPTVRQIRLHPAAVPALYPVVLSLGLRSRITVKVQPPGGGPVFSQESHIERITHEVDDKGDWWTTYDISAADTTTYLKLDDPVRGLLDSGNRVGL